MRLPVEIAHVLHLYSVQERRNFQFLIVNSFIVPATVAYLGWMIVPGALDDLRWWMAGSITFGLGMGGLAQVGFGILNDRFLGRLDLIRSSPVSKAAYYGAQISVAVGEALALGVLALLLLWALGVAILTPVGVLVAVLAALCAGTAIGGLGAAIAFRARDFDVGNTIIAICALGLAAVSPVFYDIAVLPSLLQPLAWCSPFTHIATLLRAALAGNPIPTEALIVTLVLSAALNIISYRLARWSE